MQNNKEFSTLSSYYQAKDRLFSKLRTYYVFSTIVFAFRSSSVRRQKHVNQHTAQQRTPISHFSQNDVLSLLELYE